ncbi:unnamed protein product [Onchocerca flexuosa]|uniref:Pept_C1 domain-containing protein n=1 Tax=Onchocerca flexuosa TaxID=387005 RepID=A0A183HUC9_9BILA|nr:unnamed protein product [Onchocerca flexuosa]
MQLIDEMKENLVLAKKNSLIIRKFQALAYTKSYGIASELRYPYVGTVQRCNPQQEIVKNSGYLNIPKGDESALKSAVVKYGPVVVGINASKRAFRFYKNGVFSVDNCGTPDHAVLVVGYGKHKKQGEYWIVKNSWGSGWGKDGYIHMARNKGDMCGITSMASVPT